MAKTRRPAASPTRTKRPPAAPSKKKATKVKLPGPSLVGRPENTSDVEDIPYNPNPPKRASKDASKSSTPGLSKNANPRPSKNPNPGQSKNTNTGPSKNTNTGPSKNANPDPSKNANPDPSKNANPRQSKNTNPGPSKNVNPGSSQSPNRGPSKTAKPGTSKSVNPGPLKTVNQQGLSKPPPRKKLTTTKSKENSDKKNDKMFKLARHFHTMKREVLTPFLGELLVKMFHNNLRVDLSSEVTVGDIFATPSRTTGNIGLGEDEDDDNADRVSNHSRVSYRNDWRSPFSDSD